MVPPQFYEATRIHFVRKENRNNDFIQRVLLLWVTFMGLERGRSIDVDGGSESSQTS